MRYFILLLLIVTCCGVSKAQCNCAENFEFVYTKAKQNYAGWNDKISVNNEEFVKHTEGQRQKATEETNKNYCFKIIQDWLRYFQDHHTLLYNKKASIDLAGKSEQEIRDYFSGSEKIKIAESAISASNGIEGIWQMEGGNYRVAIVKSKTTHRDFAGVVLHADSVYWVPGQIKMELTEITPEKFSTAFYMRDHSMRLITATLDQSRLRMEGLNSFIKVSSEQTDVSSTKSYETISLQTELKKLNASTLYLRLPTFNHTAKSTIDSLIQANHDLITETPNLILDVRNNGGGSDVTYAELIQYIYTNKIILVNNSIWSSPDNIQKFENILKDPEYPKSGKGYIRNLIKRLKANPGSFVKKNDNVLRKGTVLPNPKKVVVLINRGCGSSCEEFVLAARQSTKVTLMGENTTGVLDYANVHNLDLPCADWGFQYATSRTNRLPEFPIDNIGIAPAVKIPSEKNWVEFAVDYLKQK